MSFHVTACPRHCYSACAMQVQVEEGRVVSIGPTAALAETVGGPCLRGLAYLERTYGEGRLTQPLERQADGTFKPIPWEMALYRIVGKLRDIRESYGPQSVLYYAGSGSRGLLNACALDFWKAFGGCTVPYGNLRWGAGWEATRLTLGSHRQNAPAELAKAQLIVMWGKNPAQDHVHQMRYLDEALTQGAKYVVVDPCRTQSAEGANLLLQPRPGTDGALALGLAHLVLSSGHYDRDFVRDHVLGFEAFVDLVCDWTPEVTAEVTGVPEPHLRVLAQWMGTIKPMSICAGFGVQRYSNGGQAIRAMIALCAVTGNLGIQGGGWHYASLAGTLFQDEREVRPVPPAASQGEASLLPPEVSPSDVVMTSPLSAGEAVSDHGEETVIVAPAVPVKPLVRQSVRVAHLGEDILTQTHPPIRFAWVERGNPLSQSPDAHRVRQAFQSLEFRVVVDDRLTETAQEADLVLPAKSLFEQSDVVDSFWHGYLQWRPKLIDPPGEVKSETDIYREMAKHLDIKEEARKSFLPLPGEAGVEAWLAQKLSTMNITLDQIKAGPVLVPGTETVAYADRHFDTPSGKVELLSHEAALLWQVDPLPAYLPLKERPGDAYPLHCLCVNARTALSSQFYTLPTLRALGGEQKLLMHPEDAAERHLQGGQRARIYNDRGEVWLPVQLDYGLLRGVVRVHHGLDCNVNVLTGARETDMGHGAAFHDNAVQVEA